VSLSAVRHRLTPTLLLGLVCFIYILQRPVSSNNILVPVLGLLGLLAAGALIRNGAPPARGILIIIFTQLFAGAIALLVGSLHNTPGLWSQAVVLLVAPILFWTCAIALRSWMIRPIMVAAAIGTVILSLTILLFVLGEQGLFPQILPSSLLIDSGAGINPVGQSIQIRFYGLSTLVAAGPLWLASLLVPRSGYLPGSTLRSVAAASALLASLLTGRRALVVVLFLVPVLIWVVRRVLAPSRRGGPRRFLPVLPILWSSFLAGVIIVQLAPSLFSASSVTKALSSPFAFVTGALPNDARNLESVKLLNSWSSHPFLGSGAGAVVQNYFRDRDRPWNFELQYHMLLFTEGLMGATLFGVVIFLSVRFIRRAILLHPDSFSVLVATSVAACAMLIANASDPYLQAPGHMWVIYLPLGIANAVLTGPLRDVGSCNDDLSEVRGCSRSSNIDATVSATNRVAKPALGDVAKTPRH